MPLPDLDAWAVFARVAELGSFARAAEELGLSAPTVSKAIGRLEARLGERLVHRTSRRFALTEAGRGLAVRAQRMLAEAEAAEAEALAQSAAPRGRVRVSVPTSFALRYLAPILPEFVDAYPEVQVDLQLGNQVVDLVQDGIDLALRIARLPDSSLVVRRLCPVRRFVVGAPAYFARHGRPTHPAQLAAHRCLLYTYLPSGDEWRFAGPDGEAAAVRVKGPVSTNEAEALQPLLEAGTGLAVQPDYIAWESLRDGRLEAVLTGWSLPPLALHLVTPPGGPRPPRVAVLVKFLLQRFSAGKAPWHAIAERLAGSAH